MKINKFFLLGFIFISIQIFSQAVPNPGEQPEAPINPQFNFIFTYDEAGNQIYRGGDIIAQGKTVPEETIAEKLKDEDEFWNGIQVYPVPVKNLLTISWNEENNELIENVSIYQHNSLSSLIQQKNYPNINRQVRIDMSSYYMGVYILSFQLKDGRTISRNITKQ